MTLSRRATAEVGTDRGVSATGPSQFADDTVQPCDRPTNVQVSYVER